MVLREMNIEYKHIQEIDESLSEELRMRIDTVLPIYAEISGREPTIHSFHGMIGGYNQWFADLINTQFLNSEHFIKKWLNGLLKSNHKILKDMIANKKIREYTLIFLERNYYRKLIERTRYKPSESLWSLWFGNNNIYWGLLIAPILHNGIWTNKLHEIRKAKFHYWTIKHLLMTGIIDPENNEIIYFSNLEELMKFYNQILKRISNSIYEKEIYNFYYKYILNSQNPYDEPFLIPELRFAGLNKRHLYRLDFSILNSHTMEKIGFEFSPQSTHMNIKSLSNKTQKDVNLELLEKWSNEMEKRNNYFSRFNITTVTFTDEKLKDISYCFKVMEEYLNRRAEEYDDVDTIIQNIVKSN